MPVIRRVTFCDLTRRQRRVSAHFPNCVAPFAQKAPILGTLDLKNIIHASADSEKNINSCSFSTGQLLRPNLLFPHAGFTAAEMGLGHTKRPLKKPKGASKSLKAARMRNLSSKKENIPPNASSTPRPSKVTPKPKDYGKENAKIQRKWRHRKAGMEKLRAEIQGLKAADAQSKQTERKRVQEIAELFESLQNCCCDGRVLIILAGVTISADSTSNRGLNIEGSHLEQLLPRAHNCPTGK